MRSSALLSSISSERLAVSSLGSERRSAVTSFLRPLMRARSAEISALASASPRSSALCSAASMGSAASCAFMPPLRALAPPPAMVPEVEMISPCSVTTWCTARLPLYAMALASSRLCATSVLRTAL